MKIISTLSADTLATTTYKSYKKIAKTAVKNLVKQCSSEAEKTSFFLSTSFSFAGENGKKNEERPLLVVGDANGTWQKYAKKLMTDNSNAFAMGTCFVKSAANAPSTLNMQIEKGKAKPKAIAKALAKHTLKGTGLTINVSNGEESASEISEIEEGSEGEDNSPSSDNTTEDSSGFLKTALAQIGKTNAAIKAITDPAARKALQTELSAQVQTWISNYQKASAQVQQLFAAEMAKLQAMGSQLLNFVASITGLANNNLPKPNNPIKNEVGYNVSNDPADVVTVQILLIKKGVLAMPAPTGICDDATLAAIQKVQQTFMRKPDRVISPDGKTWQLLAQNSQPTPSENNTPNNSNPPQNNQLPHTAPIQTPNDLNKKGELKTARQETLGGADDEVERKMQEFTKTFTGMPIIVASGETVYVRPPYMVGYSKKYKNSMNARQKSSLTVLGVSVPSAKLTELMAKVFKLDNENSSSDKAAGKLSPGEAQAFLEAAISKGLVPIALQTADGLRELLNALALGIDCIGMAQQAMNFLFDDDMVKDSDDIKLSGKDAGNGKKVSNFAFINASNYYNALKDDKGNFGLHRVHESEKLKAGHIMSCSGHILIVIDVDVFEKHVEFTTLESTSEGNGADESTGGGQQVRWAVPKGKGFEGKIQYLKPDGTWGVPGSKSRKEAVYGYQIKVEQKLGRA